MVKATCSVDTCDDVSRARGWCWAHYLKWRKYGDPLVVKQKRSFCIGLDCDEPAYGQGMCAAHHERRRSTGDARLDEPIRKCGPRGDPEARFLLLVDRNGPIARNNPECGRCWIKRTARNKDGYASFTVNRRTFRMHRWAYMWWVGSIPDGLGLDHFACDNGAGGCVSPYHVRPASQRENVLRGNSTARNLAKTHCPRGHEYDEANTYRRRSGGRKCRACNREKQSERDRAARAALV